MKPSCAAIILGLATAHSWAQGTVTFQNGGLTFPTVANRYVYAFGPLGPGDVTDSARRLVGTNFCAGLWYVAGADNGNQLSNGRSGVQALNSIATSSSLFNFRASTTSDANKGTWLPVGGNSFVLAGVEAGQSATLQVRVWNWVTFGRSEAGYQAALSAGSGGFSAPFNYTVPAAGSTPDKYYMDNFRAFGAPEPSTIALGALCAAGLLLWGRRNASLQSSRRPE
jgi:hypothetical protein